MGIVDLAHIINLSRNDNESIVLTNGTEENLEVFNALKILSTNSKAKIKIYVSNYPVLISPAFINPFKTDIVYMYFLAGRFRNYKQRF